MKKWSDEWLLEIALKKGLKIKFLFLIPKTTVLKVIHKNKDKK
jgi:hypothetical protein